MSLLRAVIVDDEPLARACIKRALRPEDEVVVVAESGDGPAAIEAIRQHRPDLVFLDIQLPGGDGFAVLKALPRDEEPAVIFVTAYDSFAVRAFEIHAVDYLLKPFEDARLQAAVATVRERQASGELADLRERTAALLRHLGGDPIDEGGADAPVARRVLVRGADERARLLDLSEVHWIGAAGNNLEFHTASGTFEVRMTLRALVPRLDPATFRRIHRSTVVNLNLIREIQPWFAGDCLVLLKDGQRLRMSRTYRDQVMQNLL